MNLVITCQYFPYHTFPALQADNYESVVPDKPRGVFVAQRGSQSVSDDCGASE